jgi:glycosyltransferase involved in cell wall biosynthesis
MNHTILHIITTIDLGGAEKQLLTLAACQKKAGFDVEVIFLKDKPALLQDFLRLGVKVDLDFAQFGFLKQRLKLKRREFQENSVVHAHLPRAELLCALALKRQCFIVTRHNSEAFFPKGPTTLSKLLSRFVLKRSFASISISKAVANYLKISGEMSSKQNNHVIYYGLTETSVSPRSNLGIVARPIQIGTVSRLVPQKNLPLLLRALREINSQESPGFHLTIVGSGPLKKELQSLSADLGIEELITWKGQLQEVIPFYHSLDVFVLPSDYEGFGLVLLEAMSQGIPVIARRISAIPEVMGEKHPGLFDSTNPFDLALKIQTLTSNQNALRNCLQYQAQRLEEFPIEKSQREHERIYLRLLEQIKCASNYE